MLAQLLSVFFDVVAPVFAIVAPGRVLGPRLGLDARTLSRSAYYVFPAFAFDVISRSKVPLGDVGKMAAVFRTPALIVAVPAVFVSAGGRELPLFVSRSVGLLGSAMIPAMLFVLGVQLAETRAQRSPLGLSPSRGARCRRRGGRARSEQRRRTWKVRRAAQRRARPPQAGSVRRSRAQAKWSPLSGRTPTASSCRRSGSWWRRRWRGPRRAVRRVRAGARRRHPPDWHAARDPGGDHRGGVRHPAGFVTATVLFSTVLSLPTLTVLLSLL